MRFGFKSILVGSLLLMGGLLAMFRAGQHAVVGSKQPPAGATAAQTLQVFCAAGLRAPIEQAIAAFEQEVGTQVDVQFGGSNSLLASIELARKGDLYIAADDIYLQQGRERGLVAEMLPLAMQQAVLAVPKGNPKSVRWSESLLDESLRLGLASEAAAIGLTSRRILEQAGIWEQVQPRVVAFKPTVTDVANDLKLGVIDAAILWDANAAAYPEFETIQIESPANPPQPISLGVLTCSQDATAALRLARYLAARDRGLTHFRACKYQTVEGDPWDVRPELTLYSGGVLRPAVEETVAEFAAREGVTVNTVYNGCGILVAQMKAGDHPDAYLACDSSFMRTVGDRFGQIHDVSRTDMVIAVPRGNPDKIAGVQDLTRKELKLGMCNPEQSALGALSKRLLESVGLWEQVYPQVRSQTPTADLLVTQLRTGHLDAAIVFAANVKRSEQQLEAIQIDAENRSATQPVALARDSHFPQLGSRLIAAILSASSRRRFLENGFEWLGPVAQTLQAP
ncbi:MAG: substrate-binding domain-containing protein [Pirellulales bacterium]|nr:substrate-binding domain-containing protein [Pirellulales bacterium]